MWSPWAVHVVGLHSGLDNSLPRPYLRPLKTSEYGLGKGDTARRGRSVGPGEVRAGAGSWSGLGRASTGQGQGKERKVRTE